jgi:aldose 1-epimerase
LSHVTVDEGYLVLQQGAARLTLDPPRGGAIREFDWQGVPIFRPTEPAAGDEPLEVACFPMIPFVNRIARGRFEFGGRSVQLSRNWSGDPHPLHGYGWRAPWSVVGGSSSSATIRFDGGGNEWPWQYRGEQHFQLLPDGLSIELSIENLSDTRMPAMLGLHPYFHDAAHARLSAALPRVWLTDEAALPVAEAPTPPAWGFDPGRIVNTIPLDHCFSGWDGIATLRWPDRTVTVRATDCSCLQIYAPAGKDFFCVEPLSAAAGALGRKSDQLIVIAPGERAAIRVHFSVDTI